MPIGQDLLQFRQSQVGTGLKRLQKASLGRLIDLAPWPVALLDAVGLTVLPMLPAHFLHPAHTHTEQLCKLMLGALAARVGVKEFAAQIIFVGSRHRLRGGRQSYLIVTLNML